MTRWGALLMAMVVFCTACGASDSTRESMPDELSSDEPNVVESVGDEHVTAEPASDERRVNEDDPLDGCASFPSYSEGSYYVEPDADRSDLTALAGADLDRLGMPLTVRLTIVEAETCAPYANQAVELWGASADGRYSGLATQPDGTDDATLGETWLRGRHETDADGVVEFTTVVPGWIAGQAPHLHVSTAVDATRSFTARLVLPDEQTETIYATGAYASRGGAAVTVAAEAERDPGIERSVIALSPTSGGFRTDVVLGIAEVELREPPLSAIASTSKPGERADHASTHESTRNFDQLGGELQAMFNEAGADLGIDPEQLYAEFRLVSSEAPPDLRAIAARLGVAEEALSLALPLLAGGAPAPAG